MICPRSSLPTVRGTQLAGDGWQYGGGGDLFPDLHFDRAPDMTGSGAPEALQQAWIAIAMGVGFELGGLRDGSCYYLNLAGWPIVQQVLGEPVAVRAGFAAFVSVRGRFECGFRWRPDKWRDWIDRDAARHLTSLQDIHVWLETKSHIIDLSTGDRLGDPEDVCPPLIYWPKWQLPKHPREARGRRTMLLWRSKEALATTTRELAPVLDPVIKASCTLAVDLLNARAAIEKALDAERIEGF